MRTHFYLLLAVCLPVSLFSQNTLRGKIIDAKGQPVEFAAVTLLLKSDSSLVKGEVTDGSGVYEMINIAPGSYFMETSMIGYATSRSDVFEIKNQPAAFELPALLLREAVAVLDEVVVKERKPFITQQIDRTVLNIENSITGAGANVLELLAKAPGVMVDDNGTISLRGKASVLIYIDGKPTYLAGNQLMELLRSTPATNIASIEIITNPPAKYDAAGNAGIINIKMKKNQADGFNGNVSGSFTQGFYDKENAGINLNFRQGKLNLFGNYNFSNWQGFNRLELHRNFHDNGELAAVFDQNNFSTWKGLNHSIRTGLDFSPSDKTTIGVLLTGTNSDNRGRGHNITFLQDGAYQLESIADTRFVSDGYWRNLTANANLKHTFDTLGRELTADLDYALYRQENQQRFTTLYTDDNGQTNRPDYSLRSVLPGNIDIYSAKVDYSNPLGKDAKWEAGAKASYVTNDNDARFFNVLENGSETPEASMTNYFVYSEQIMAAYANYSAKWGKTSVQFGLRGEHTNARGDQRTIDSTFHRQYFQLFPSAFLQREFGKDHQLGLSYSRRIERPNYENLNPFRFFLDPYTFEEGNPYLKPQLSHAIDLNHTFKGRYTTTLSYSRTNDMISEVLLQNDAERTTYQTKRNLGMQEVMGVSISAPVELAEWWRAQTYVAARRNHITGPFAGGIIDQSLVNFSANITNNITLPEKVSLEISGFYTTGELWGVVQSKPIYAISAGLQKPVLDGKGSIRLNARDLFRSQRFRGTMQYQNIDTRFVSRWDSQTVSLSFNYRFGKQTVKGARQRSTGLEEEKGRVGKGG